MCTVIAQHGPGGWTVTMNRDERRTRSEGDPPFRWDEPVMLAPRDADAGGTWIGVRPNGIWACLLNGYLEEGGKPEPVEPQTRGRIIPAIMGADDPLQHLLAEDLSQTRSFRLWLGYEDGIIEAFWDGSKLYHERRPAAARHFASSSALAQAEVLRLRGELFAQWTTFGAEKLTNGIPKVLVEANGLAPSLAIPMQSDDAHTKSCTQIIVDSRSVRMQHWFMPDVLGAPVASEQLPRKA